MFKPALLAICLMFLSATAPAKENLHGLSFSDFENQPISLESQRGNVVLLNFWATWCPPCIKEMPSMQRLRDSLAGEKFEIVAVNVGESPTAVSSFLLQLEPELEFTILLDEEGRSFGELGLRGMPMSLIYDQNGELITTVLGGREWDSPEMVAEFRRLIGQ